MRLDFGSFDDGIGTSIHENYGLWLWTVPERGDKLLKDSTRAELA